VLDVAAGNGNFALAAAREGAGVVASDLSERMVELGRRRSEAEGYDIEWVVADAEELPYEDGRFDCAASVFGAMFTPQPERAAAELFRVVRPGGTVGMANWVPGGMLHRQFELTRRYAPPAPEGMPEPLDWGDEEVVARRFEGLAARIEAERRGVPFRWASAEAAWDFFDGCAPTQQALRESIPEDDYAALRDDTIELFREYAGDDGAIAVESDYLLIVARKRG
jgi:SAM-dependent methyltransferase